MAFDSSTVEVVFIVALAALVSFAVGYALAALIKETLSRRIWPPNTLSERRAGVHRNSALPSWPRTSEAQQSPV
ncbi:MAG TPA: hypothetical protein VGS23_06520 [Thermoplasmata archaeon]|nr:hypothetical protein [Thermoplasmata archaeon]